jgi:hypothetical protein
MRTTHVLGLVTLVPALIAFPGNALPYSVSHVRVLNSHGGSGGETFSLACPQPGMVVVGISGTSGTYVDNLVLRCARLQPDGTPGQSTIDMASGQAGGGGGSYFQLFCGPKEVAVGISGRAGDLLDAISLYCAPLASWVGASNPSTNPTDIRGGGGGVQFQERCPNGYALAAMTGRSHDYIDAVAPVCLLVEP